MKVLQGFMMFLGMLTGVMMDLLGFGPKLCPKIIFFKQEKARTKKRPHKSVVQRHKIRQQTVQASKFGRYYAFGKL